MANNEKEITFLMNEEENNHLLQKLANTEEALISSEKKFKYLFDYSSDEIFLYDLKGKIIEVNQQACECLGYTREDLIGMHFSDIKTPRYRELVAQHINKIREVSRLTYESEHLTKMGTLVPVEIKSRMISYNGKAAIMSVARNITERKALEQKMISIIIETEEKERKRFAADLHDELGPILSTLKLYSDLLKKGEFKKISKEEVLKNIDELSDLAIQTSNSISKRITPAVLQDFGLAAAIQEFCKFINESGAINVQVKTEKYSLAPRSLTETVLYQATKELINNTIKHASAENITIELKNTDKQLILYYKDDGIGFDLNKQLELSIGLGLTNIINKVRTIKGSCDFHSSIGKGMIVVITVNLDKE